RQLKKLEKHTHTHTHPHTHTHTPIHTYIHTPTHTHCQTTPVMLKAYATAPLCKTFCSPQPTYWTSSFPSNWLCWGQCVYLCVMIMCMCVWGHTCLSLRDR